MDKDLKDSLYLINNGFAFFVTTLGFVYLGIKIDELLKTKYFMLIMGFIGVGVSIYVFFIELPRRHDANKLIKDGNNKKQDELKELEINKKFNK